MPWGARSRSVKAGATLVAQSISAGEVRRQLVRYAEKKLAGVNLDLSFNSTIGSSSECYPLLPTITEGTAGNQRIGNKIRPKYLIVKGKIQYNNSFLDTAGTQFIPPCTVRAMILTQKSVRYSGAVSTDVDVSHLLKDNIGTDVARSYSGTQYDNLAPINTELFNVIMDKKIKFNWINHQVVLTDPGVSISHDSGNDRTKYFYCKVPVPANLYFDDGSGNYPNNFAPFFCFGSVMDDGSSPWTASTPYHVTIQSALYYTDV